MSWQPSEIEGYEQLVIDDPNEEETENEETDLP